jgi:hypothetical protein
MRIHEAGLQPMVKHHKVGNNDIHKGLQDTIKELVHDKLDVIDVFVSDSLDVLFGSPSCS